MVVTRVVKLTPQEVEQAILDYVLQHTQEDDEVWGEDMGKNKPVVKVTFSYSDYDHDEEDYNLVTVDLLQENKMFSVEVILTEKSN